MNRVNNPKPRSVEVWCLFFYKTPTGLGALVLRKSGRHVDAYERLGLLEVYLSHPGFQDIAEAEEIDVRIV